MPTPMPPDQAIAILDQIAAKTPMGRQDHQTVLDAVAVLHNLVEEVKGLREKVDRG